MTSTGVPEAPIDPRIRARRRDVRRREGRRRLRRLGLGVAVAALALAGALAALSPVLDVDRVEVRGAARTAPDDVRRVAGIEPGGPMLTVREGRATSSVESLPWVARATVVRSWPATVVVTVEERVASAVVHAGSDRGVLLDVEGRQLAVVSRAEAAATGLTTIEGPPFDPAPGQAMAPWAAGALDVARHLEAAFEEVAVRVVLADGVLEARMQGPPVGDLLVRFGGPDRLEAKVVALSSVLAAGGSPPVLVDVRAPGAPALTRAAS